MKRGLLNATLCGDTYAPLNAHPPATHCSASTPGRRRCTRPVRVAAAAAAARVCRGRLGPAALGFLAPAAAARGCLKPGSRLTVTTWLFLRAVDLMRAILWEALEQWPVGSGDADCYQPRRLRSGLGHALCGN